MAFLKRTLGYLPEILVAFFLIVTLWILFLPQLESPFRIKLDDAQARTVFLFSILFALTSFFANYLLPRSFSALKFKGLFIVGFNVFIFFSYFFWILTLLGLPFNEISHRNGVVGQPLWSTFLCGYSALLGYLLYYYKKSLADKDALLKKEKEWQEIHFSALKNQLNPHFLFNMLNNIDAEINHDPAFASDMLIRLSKLMRYVIYEEDKVSLSREVRFMEDYIQLQTDRNRLKVKCIFQQQIQNHQMLIAPAIFLPYIENAFKYGDLSSDAGCISILMSQGEEGIRFSISNPVAGLQSSFNNRGKGLEIAEKRLQLFYPNNFSLHLEHTNNIFSVQVDIWKP